jgi:hypothetical protein
MRKTKIAILLLSVCAACAAASAQDAARSSETTGTWHWFGSCEDTRNLSLVVLLDGKAVYRSRFPVCRNNGPSPTAEERKIVFHFKGGHIFQGEYRTSPTQTIEANIWQAGADPNALLLGVTFVTDRVLLNTIHVAKPDNTSVSQLDQGIVVSTFPLTRKKFKAIDETSQLHSQTRIDCF